jgi:transposase
MTYRLEVRKLAIKMILEYGVLKTSKLLKISRITLWRWQANGVEIFKRVFKSHLFETIKNKLEDILMIQGTRNAIEIANYFKESLNITISKKTIYKYIKKIGYSRKRIRTRGICKGDLEALTKSFCARYKESYHMNNLMVAVDESGHSEKTVRMYGYSKIGNPCIMKVNGSWINHSLLMAINSEGEKAFIIKKGAIKKDDFEEFVDSLNLDESSTLVLDNASIHKNLCLTTKPNILYTPPYSPEFNPIELCFGITKGYFREGNNNNTDITHLINQSVTFLTPTMIKNCFEHVQKNFIGV